MAKFLKPYRLVIILYLLAMSRPLNATPVQTVIHFGKNQTSKMWVSQLSPKQDSLLYQFNASKNQYATLVLMPRRGYAEFANVGVIISPTGNFDGGKGGTVYQGCLPQSGNYTIRIARNLMASNGAATGFVAKLTILPVGKSQQKCA